MNHGIAMMISKARNALGYDGGADVGYRCFLIGFRVCPTGRNTFLILEIWPSAHGWGVHNPRGGHTTIPLLVKTAFPNCFVCLLVSVRLTQVRVL